MIEALLFGDAAASAASGPRRNVVMRRDQLAFDLTALRSAVEQLPAGGCLAYAVPLNLPAVARLVTLVALAFHLRRVERTIVRGGAQVVARYGVDPTLEAPSCIYDLDTSASDYADRSLRPRGSAEGLRRVLARWFGCDPALGAVVVVGRKP